VHIPDGLLSAPVSVTCTALSALAVGAAAIRVQARLGPRAVSMLGVTAAFLFAAQTLNFPIGGATSGHLIGGVLAAALLGPASAVIVMTAVLLLQCLVFGDGGLLSLGANVLNMGVVHPIVGSIVCRLIAGRTARAGRERGWRRLAAAAFAAWLATVLGAAICAGELALSKVASAPVILTAMVGVHVVIGLGEALITALVLSAVMRMRPELLDRADTGRRASPGVLSAGVLGLVPSLALALFVSPFASAWPDGLTRVASRFGLEPTPMRFTLWAPFNGYAVPGIAGDVLAASLAAGTGTLLVFALCVVVGAWLSRVRRDVAQDSRRDSFRARS
jgi:cobalt/nickel transport system permease protein